MKLKLGEFYKDYWQASGIERGRTLVYYYLYDYAGDQPIFIIMHPHLEMRNNYRPGSTSGLEPVSLTFSPEIQRLLMKGVLGNLYEKINFYSVQEE